MEDIKYLIRKIEQSNLSDSDKQLLLEKLQQREPDLDGFVKALLSTYNLAKDIIELFDIDIGNWI